MSRMILSVHLQRESDVVKIGSATDPFCAVWRLCWHRKDNRGDDQNQQHPNRYIGPAVGDQRVCVHRTVPTIPFTSAMPILVR